ncbi:MAG: hypothetical protein PF503_07330 [Desulfobacula sp.]|jgi:hypothetical protein|nr:hypothetical protein [Desulfobacula sp.]
MNTSIDYKQEKLTKQELEVAVVSVRLELYNRDRPCGPKPILKRLEEFHPLCSLPSERTIARILSQQGLTHRRTGWYE